jgi:hypothetical protein
VAPALQSELGFVQCLTDMRFRPQVCGIADAAQSVPTPVVSDGNRSIGLGSSYVAASTLVGLLGREGTTDADGARYSSVCLLELTAKEWAARSLGLALLDASCIYEDFLIPRSEGLLRRRPFPPHRRAIIGLVGCQRRFLRAAYTLADWGLVLEAIGPLRSMFEFLVCQRCWRMIQTANWKLWMQEDHAARDL